MIIIDLMTDFLPREIRSVKGINIKDYKLVNFINKSEVFFNSYPFTRKFNTISQNFNYLNKHARK